MALKFSCSFKIGQEIVMDGLLTIRHGIRSAISMPDSEGVGEVACKPIGVSEIIFEVFLSFSANCGFQSQNRKIS